jgi:hypothetical protein
MEELRRYLHKIRPASGKNIRAAIDKIRAQSPALGRRFATAIRTGFFCCYQPAPDEAVS